MLAVIASHQGDLETAEHLYRQALSVRSELAVSGPYLVQIVKEEVASFGTSSAGGVTRE